MSSDLLQGRYRLDEVVDSGATATVWRGLDRHLDRPVAIKILDRQRLGANTEEAKRFRDEARALARLSHPNIVTVFDSGTEDGLAFLIMELVEGRTVRSRLDEGVLPAAEAVAVMAQVCDALAAAHAAGVVHRDIKPGNIVVTPAGKAKLCDFGIARLEGATALTASHIALGTSSYMAPEQITGHALDGRADLYAVGCVLFEMLTGTPPFTGDTAFSVAYQHVHDEPPNVRSLRSHIPSGLDSLVGSLLAKDPSRRPAAAAQVRAALTAHMDSGTANIRTAGASAARAEDTEAKDAGTDDDDGTVAIVRPAALLGRGRGFYARAGLVAGAIVVVPALVYAAWPEPPSTAPYVPPAAVDSTSSASPRATPSAVPEAVVTATIVARPGASEMTPLPIPNPSVPAAAQSPLEQVMALKTLVRQLSDSGEVGTREGGELDRLLNDVANQIVQGKSKEAQDKIAAVRKKNDDLLRDRKISVAGHDAIASRLAQLSEAVAATAG